MDFALLQKFGIPVVPHQVTHQPSDALRAAAQIRYPVALKLMSPQVLHKSEHHALSLNLHDEKSVEREFARLKGLVSPWAFEGVLVQKYLPSRLEIIIGGRQDAQFGPVLLIGMGGLYTELLHDVSLRVCPIDEAEALDMIRTLRAYPILSGARGQTPVDLKKLAKMLVAVSALLIKIRPKELDINPVLVTPDGLYAADVRIIR